MFYCEPCRVKKDWPTSVGSSRGKCECCGEVAICHDRPSSSLPKPTTAPAEEQCINRVLPDGVGFGFNGPDARAKQARIDQMAEDAQDQSIKEGLWPFDFADLRIDTYRVKSGGGFSLNRNDTAVRIKHLPSGLEASAHEERSQHRNKVDAMRTLANLVRQWKEAGSPVADPNDPFPGITDAELGFSYRMMVKAARGGLVVNFDTGDISLPKGMKPG